MNQDDLQSRMQGSEDLQRSKEQSHTRLVGAKETLKEKLMHAVMQQAMDEVGDPDAIATKIMSRLSGEAFLKTATLNLRRQMLAEITQQALEAVSRESGSAQELAKSLVKDKTAVIDALKTHITKSIQDSALQSIADPIATAGKLSEDLVADRAEILAVVEALRSRLHQEIARESLTAFQDVEETANKIHETLDLNDDAILLVGSKLNELLGKEIGKRAVEQLGDSDDVARTIRARMGKDPEFIDDLAENVSGLLAAEAEERVIERLTGTGQVAEDVAAAIRTQNADVIEGIVSQITENITDDVAKRARESLADAERVAKSAKARMGAYREVVGPVGDRLREMLLDEIAHASVEDIDVEEASKKAYALVDKHADVLAEVRNVVRDQIINDMVTNAIHEIRTEVDGAAQAFSRFGDFVKPMPLEDDPEIDQIRQEVFGAPDREPASGHGGTDSGSSADPIARPFPGARHEA